MPIRPQLTPNWFATAYGGYISGGSFQVNGRSSLTVQHMAASFANDTSFSTNVRVISRATQLTWLTSGVAIYKDASNFWATHLVEAPAASGSTHFIELAEMKNGVWQSTAQDAVTISSTGTSYNWQYGVDYSVNLTMTIGGSHPTTKVNCLAKVQSVWTFASNGSVVSSISYCITNPQGVLTGRGAFHLSSLNTIFTNVTSSWNVPVDVIQPTTTFPAWNSSISCTQLCSRKATGFFRVEQDSEGKWWFIDPVGNPFYFVAVDHVNYYQFATEALGGFAEYHYNVSIKYGNESSWADAQVKRLLSWGFNTLGTDVSTKMRYKGLAHTITHTTNDFSARVSDITPKTTWTGFPNVFHPQWTDFLFFTFSDYLQYRDDPWVIGHFVDNEIQWWGDIGCSSQDYCLFNQVWVKEANHTAKIAWANLLVETFGLANLETEFINGWNVTGITSLSALLQHNTPAIPLTTKAASVGRQFVRIVAELYFSTVSKALKSVDPNHVYLCNRFPAQAPDIVDIAAKYCDVITYNWYPTIDVNLGIPKQVADVPAKWVGSYNRPLIITEWSFPALDAGLPSTHGAGMRVDTQAQRAKCYAYFNAFLQSHPLVVGNSYFMYVDEPALGISTSFPENSNYGLLNVNDDPYPLMVQVAVSQNFKVCSRHYTGWNTTTYGTKPLISAVGTNFTAQNLVGSIPDGLGYDFGSVKVDGSVVRLYWKGSRLATLRITTGTKLASESATAWNAPDTTSSVLQASISSTNASVIIQQKITSRGLIVTIQVNVASFTSGIPIVVVQFLSIQNLRTDGQSILVQSVTTNGEAHIGDVSFNGAKTQSTITKPDVPNHWLRGTTLYNSTSLIGFGTVFFTSYSSTWTQQSDSVTVLYTALGDSGTGVNITYGSTFVPTAKTLHVVFPFTVSQENPYMSFIDAFSAVQASFGISNAIPEPPVLKGCTQPTSSSPKPSFSSIYVTPSSSITPKSSRVVANATQNQLQTLLMIVFIVLNLIYL